MSVCAMEREEKDEVVEAREVTSLEEERVMTSAHVGLMALHALGKALSWPLWFIGDVPG